MPSIHLLVGFPGTGKYTVAKELVRALEERGETPRLVDAHYVNNPVFGLVEQDGVRPLPKGIWPIVERVREALLDTIEQISPPQYSFVFTNFITQRGSELPHVIAYLDRLQAIAAARQSQLHVTRLTCDVDELCRRIVGPDRVARMKMTSAEGIREAVATETLYEPTGLPCLTLDVTHLPPDQAAAEILRAAAATSPGPAAS